MSNSEALSRLENISVIGIAVMSILLGILALVSAHNKWLLWLAASVCALGGVVNEIAQSGGRLFVSEA